MIRTAVENRQNLIVEGCYIPFSWAEDFEKDISGGRVVLHYIFRGKICKTV